MVARCARPGIVVPPPAAVCDAVALTRFKFTSHGAGASLIVLNPSGGSTFVAGLPRGQPSARGFNGATPRVICGNFSFTFVINGKGETLVDCRVAIWLGRCCAAAGVDVLSPASSTLVLWRALSDCCCSGAGHLMYFVSHADAADESCPVRCCLHLGPVQRQPFGQVHWLTGSR